MQGAWQASARGQDCREDSGVEGECLSWDYTIPFTSRFVLWDVLRWSLLTTVIAEVFFLGLGALTGNLSDLATPLVIGGIAAAVLGLCTMGYLLTALLLLNGYRGRFTISPQGVGFQAGPAVRRLNSLALVVGLLSGRPGPVGAAMVAESQEQQWYLWPRIRKVSVHRQARVISLDNAWRTVLRVYCPFELFPEIVSRVEQYAAAGEAERLSQPAAPPRQLPLLAWIGWLGAAAVATLLCLAWTYDEEYPRYVALLAGLLAAVGGLAGRTDLGRRIGLMAVMASLAFLASLALLAAEQRSLFDGLFVVYGYEREPQYLLFSVVGGLGLLALGGLRLRRGP